MLEGKHNCFQNDKLVEKWILWEGTIKEQSTLHQFVRYSVVFKIMQNIGVSWDKCPVDATTEFKDKQFSGWLKVMEALFSLMINVRH